ncbi:MAG TPA: PilZ domain-containing protein [Sphingomonas sp.]|jgi:hypothetical protein|nr:PilZ domain-containing protein [Sphingomonas sp.]
MATRTSQFRKVDAAALDRRAAPRHRVEISRATVRGHGAEPLAAFLCDVSIYGCRLAFPAASLGADRVWLRLDGSLPIAATIVWRQEDSIGCRFDTPIERTLMRSLTIQQ